METLLKERINKRKNNLTEQLHNELSSIAHACAPVWQKVNQLDSVLLSSLSLIPNCKLLYAVECHGVQISSNIKPEGIIKKLSRGQDLSHRPYMLNMKSEMTFSLSPVYLSKTGRKPCITAMHQVFDETGNAIGCVAADFDIEDLPDEDNDVFKHQQWRQLKGDPAIRKNLFQQERVTSAMDEHLDQVNDIINNLISERGIFHAKLHYSSSRATLWPYRYPYEYRLHVLEEIIAPEVCLAYPACEYPKEARVPKELILSVFNRFKELRNADETIYLRSASLNVINAMIGLNFSCDGSHYMSVDEFLDKADSFWFGS